MKLFAGIDGGQSSTIAVVADEHKTILGRGVAGPCDHIGQAPDSPRFARALEGAIAAALVDAKLPADSEFEAIVAGISGYEGVIHGLAPLLRARRVSYVHDARIAHAGAFELRDGIVVIAGTGSVAYGRDVRGNETTVGGWGFLFGDEGSAFVIARDALASAMHSEDAGRSSELVGAAQRFFELPSLRTVARGFYTGVIDRKTLASFAKPVVVAAQAGDPEAGSVTLHAAHALGALAATCASRLGIAGAIEVALCGGMFESDWFRARATEQIGLVLPEAQVVPSHTDPAGGALLLAYKEGADI
ncbi:MAG: BadF/BadG/BcrA/BcrD ATPase family protein [Vulcanimicrobiaceae bacterium]